MNSHMQILAGHAEAGAVLGLAMGVLISRR